MKKWSYIILISLFLVGCGNSETLDTETELDSATEIYITEENDSENEYVEIQTEIESTEDNTYKELNQTMYANQSVNGSDLSDEKTTVSEKNPDQQLDQYGGYLEYTHSYGGDYCIGEYKFSVDDFGTLSDGDKQFYKALADAGVGNIAYLGTDSHGGRTYAVMYYAPCGGCSGVWYNNAILSALTNEPDTTTDPWFWH